MKKHWVKKHQIKKTSDNETTDSVVKTIGLRTLTISQDKDQWGSEFCFNVNGVKIFTRGGNYIPDDAVYPNITTEKIDYILKSCVRANFNCVRVWGGGFFPSDAFFDLCDRYGLIVWQDLLFACNVYDVNDDFVENVSRETEDNVRRIRHHACLGLWCGNNEIESAWHHWGDFQTESDYLRADYIRLFEEILPRVVKENDPDTFYWRSSPSSVDVSTIRMTRTGEIPITGMCGMDRNLLRIIRNIFSVSVRNLASSRFHR